MSDKKDITRKNLEILTEDILKAMVTSLINGMKFNSDQDKITYLKNKGYTHNHNSWSKTKLINFLLKFNPKVSK